MRATLLLLALAWPSLLMAGFPGGFLAVGAGGSGGAVGTISTFPVVNDGATLQSADVPTQEFGLPFKDGQICGGAAPVLKAGSTVQPYSYSAWRRVFYASGCLAWVPVRMRPSFSLAGTVALTASISGTTMCVTVGSPSVGQQLTDATQTVIPGTTITATGGTCGAGTPFQVSYSQTVSSEAITAENLQNITVAGGGAWPSASSRTTAEILAQGLQINAPPVGVSGDNLTGSGTSCATNCGAWLSSTNAANLIQSYCDMDGDAGKDCYYSYWMSGTNGGAKHGELVADFYVQSLNTTSGALGGFRWFGAIRQPYYNIVGSNKNPRSFKLGASGLGWSVGGGANIPITMPAGIVPTTFTAPASTGTLIPSAASSNYYSGSYGQNVVPAVLTTTGSFPTTSPSTLNANTIYFVQSSCPCPTLGSSVTLGTSYTGVTGNNSSGVLTMTSGTGSGTHTFNPVATINQFGKIQFADDHGRYLFFQGTGSVTAENSERVEIDQAQWEGSGFIPPFDLTQIGTTHIPDTNWNYAYWYGNYGHVLQDPIGATGDTVSQHGDLGPIPDQQAVDFFVQSQNSDRGIRAIGLGGALLGYDFKDVNTNTIVDLISGVGGTASNYTGLPASVSTTISWGSFAGGFTLPPNGNSTAMGFSSSDVEHQPHFAYYPYLRFGEIPYLHNLMDIANGDMLAFDGGQPGGGRNPTEFGAQYGVPYSMNLQSGETRTLAWQGRTIEAAANVVPYNPATPTAVGPDGTDIGKYFVDMATAGCSYVANIENPSNSFYGAQTSYLLSTRHLFMPGETSSVDSNNRVFMMDASGWQRTIYGVGWAFAAAGPRKDANCKAALANLGLDFQYVVNTFGGWHLDGYYDKNGGLAAPGFPPSLCSHCSYPPNASDADFGIQTQGSNTLQTLSWTVGTATSGNLLFCAVTGGATWAPATGDAFIFVNGNPTPGGFSDSQSYYIVDLNSGTGCFNLATTKGNPATRQNVTGSNSSAIAGQLEIRADPSNPAISNTWAGFFPGGTYPGEIVAISNWGLAVDATQTQWNTVLTDQNARLAHGQSCCGTTPQWGNDIGPRYTYQSTFH